MKKWRIYVSAGECGWSGVMLGFCTDLATAQRQAALFQRRYPDDLFNIAEAS